MQVTGSFIYKAPPEVMYRTFTDHDALLFATPGLRSLEEVAPDTYEAVLKVGVGGFNLVYEGRLTVSERRPPLSYRLQVDATTHNGYGHVDGHFRFVPLDSGGTRVEYAADVTLGGGQKLLPALARGMMDFFLHGMAEWLRNPNPAEPILP